MEGDKANILDSSGESTAGRGFLGEKADEYARAYAEETPGGFALLVRRRRVLELFDKPGGRVLDVGCGPAEMARPLLRLDCEFWGLDPSPRMIEICRTRFGELKNVHFVEGEAGQMSFPDAFFDVVLCMGVIDGLKSFGQVIEEMLRVLKPGGTIIITFANRQSPYAQWKKYVFYPALTLTRRIMHPGAHNDPILIQRRLFTPKEASGILAAAGADAQRVVGYFYNILLSPLDEVWPAATLWLNKKLEEARDGKADWLAAGFILKVHKTNR
jgi:demethylmenaquinone methyltransferase/2-methoxy-6-polyprenyl-1,4-benzoquinol methylase